MEETGAAQTWWDDNLTRSLRAILHLYPFHELRLHDNRRHAAELEHYNALTIAIKIIDAIIENAGLETEHDRDTLCEALYPVLASMDSAAGIAPDPDRHRLIVLSVLGQLRNDAKHRDPFSYRYAAFNAEGERRDGAVTFHLIRDEYHPSGRIVLRLTTQAMNVFLNAAEFDLESQQVATEAMLAYQLKRGKLEEARQLAETARRLSMQYQEKVKRVIHDTRRNLDTVDWHHDVPALLRDAISHLSSRLPVEHEILAHAEQQLDVIENEQQAQLLVRVRDVSRDCQRRHIELHQHLIGTEKVFLEEQERQRFNPRPPRFAPDIQRDVLDPLLRATIADAEPGLTRAVGSFFPAQARPVFSLVDLTQWQFMPRRASGAGETAIAEVAFQDVDLQQPRYAPEVRERATAILASIAEPTPLSETLAQLEAEGVSDDVLDVVAYMAIRYFAPEPEEEPLILAERTGRRLRDSRFYGDDLLLSPAEGKNA